MRRRLPYADVCCFESVCIFICRTLSPRYPYHNTDAIARLAARDTHVCMCVYVCVCAMHICENVVFSMDFTGGTRLDTSLVYIYILYIYIHTYIILQCMCVCVCIWVHTHSNRRAYFHSYTDDRW
jgi:hypothetical protein